MPTQLGQVQRTFVFLALRVKYCSCFGQRHKKHNQPAQEQSRGYDQSADTPVTETPHSRVVFSSSAGPETTGASDSLIQSLIRPFYVSIRRICSE